MNHSISIPIAEPTRGLLDFSYLLDAPAGCHGFVTSRDGHLYFEDGTRARFLGFNLATRSNTPSHRDAERLAARLASLGVNVVRLHAADAPLAAEGEDHAGSWSSSRKTPLIDYDRKTSRYFHPEGLDRFDYLAAKLKEKGIYLHIDLLVAREFTEGDDLDYPGSFPSCTKRFTMYNERLKELQKEYARELLCHVNPYTGLALKDDPAVMTVQINNEESAIKGTDSSLPELRHYREEVSRRFGQFLLMKYHTRENLKKAWTFEGVCALGEDEDPALGTVRGIEGSFYQTVSEPAGPWDSAEGPARYADFMEFGAYMNRSFYQEMMDFLKGLGVRVPVVTSNLMAGAADVYGHAGADMMENNSYFNHPMFPLQGDNYMVYGPTEYVGVNPLTVQMGVGALGTTILSMASLAIVEGKPFTLSEWNEYGLHPFHSTAFVHTVAYACLNDWDGLILYNYNTSDQPDDEKPDEILTVFDAYNDPALISQFGFMAHLFLKGLVSPARNRVDVVYTKNDWKSLPNFNAMPACFFPYVTAIRNVFLEEGDRYQGDADLAVNAGFFDGGDLSEAAHSAYYAWSPYRDPLRRASGSGRLTRAAEDTEEIQPGVHLGEKSIVFDNIAGIAGSGDYRQFASLMDQAMKSWGILKEGTGLVEDALVSDTGELTFDPNRRLFRIQSPKAAYFSGDPAPLEGKIRLSDRISVNTGNERLSLALLSLEGTLDSAKEFLLTAVGKTGTDQASYTPGPELMPGLRFTNVRLDGKLYSESLEGVLLVKASKARLELLDLQGNVMETLRPEATDQELRFTLSGSLPSFHMHLVMEE